MSVSRRNATRVTDAFNEGRMPIDRMHALVRRYITAFFTYHLKGIANYGKYLEPRAAEQWNAGFNDFTWTTGAD